MEKEVKFSYGALSGTLEEQAGWQGVTLGDKAERLEAIRRSINMLMLHDILTDGEAERARKKLHKQVIKNLKGLKP